jgi:hypothetical protein
MIRSILTWGVASASRDAGPIYSDTVDGSMGAALARAIDNRKIGLISWAFARQSDYSRHESFGVRKPPKVKKPPKSQGAVKE